MFLLCNSNGRTDIFDVLEHENWVLFSILQLLEEEEWLFIIAQTSFYTIACSGVSDTEQMLYPFKHLPEGP